MEPEDTYVYNLGNLFFVDRVLFTETSDVLKIMEEHSTKVVKEEVVKEGGGDEEVFEDFGVGIGQEEEEEMHTQKEVSRSPLKIRNLYRNDNNAVIYTS